MYILLYYECQTKKAANRVETKNMIMMMIAPILTFFVRLFWWWKTHSLIWIGWFGVCVCCSYFHNGSQEKLNETHHTHTIHTYISNRTGRHIYNTHQIPNLFFCLIYIRRIRVIFFRASYVDVLSSWSTAK